MEDAIGHVAVRQKNLAQGCAEMSSHRLILTCPSRRFGPIRERSQDLPGSL